MTDTVPIGKIRGVVRSADWSDDGFDLTKAYACALLAEAAYWEIPEFELRKGSRVKVIPSLEYERIVSHHQGSSFQAVARGADFSASFALVTHYAIIVGLRADPVTFVAIRGTHHLYDWFVNLRFGKERLWSSGHAVAFHRGFLRAIVPSFGAIRERIRMLGSPGAPVYVAGHSLGGALAAIVHDLWRAGSGSRARGPWCCSEPLGAHSCYTFGMPRYGDESSALFCRSPFHVFRPGDIVPCVPPRFFGYADCTEQFRLDEHGLTSVPAGDGSHYASWLGHLISGRGIADHAVEGYRTLLERAVDEVDGRDGRT